MPHLDQRKAYEDLRDGVLEGIKEHFPMKGKLKSVELNNLEVREKDLHAGDIQGQHKARMDSRTWGASVYGNVSLRDNETGKVVSNRKVRLAQVPMMTQRQSYILGGTEYQVKNQWQLKPGVYVSRGTDGVLRAKFNPQNKVPFDIRLDPKNKQFFLRRKGSEKIPVYPVLKALGVDDDSLERSWGRELLESNKKLNIVDGLNKFYKADKKKQPKTPEEAANYVRTVMGEAKLRSDSTKITLGKGYDVVDGNAVKAATEKILKVYEGMPEDDRDSLVFKNLRTAGDFAKDKLTHWKFAKSIRGKVNRKVNFADDVSQVIKFDMFDEPVRQSFHKNEAAGVPKQLNPVEMLASSQETTIMGPGGVQSQNVLDSMVDTKFINPSHFGFLDPVRTPEGGKSGAILRLPMGLEKQNQEPVIPLYNTRTGKVDKIGPAEFEKSTVVLPDQVTWKAGKPVALKAKVKASSPGNRLVESDMADADYVMRHPSQVFSLTTNLIPFLGSNSGNRATYAGQQIEQAISLENREAPLVQVGTGSTEKGISTFEEVIGQATGHPSPVNGVVTRVTDDAIYVKGRDGKEREVQLYRNFPLNETKAVIHSEPLVKAGDEVSAGSAVADTNFSRDGVLALGSNLKVGYLPYKGYNFEDGVVISKSAANKLTSKHMHKPELKVEHDTVLDPQKFVVQHPDAFSPDQYKKLNKEGVVRVGQRVRPGDPLIAAMRPYQLKDRMGIQQIGRALVGGHTDMSMRWKSDHEGEVVKVYKTKDGVTVHVKTLEPMQVGDKLSGRYGNKGIVTRILDDDKMPQIKSGGHVEVALNPAGVPGRMNVGQVLETAASKVAEKTGKPYVVQNFSPEDQLARVRKELKKNGLSDQEELIDPDTGKSIGKALVGKQYMLKMMQQIDHKVSARAGMGLPGGEADPEAYDSNLIPGGGGMAGGQRMDPLGLYVLLAHGAKANIREMQTWKSEGPDPQTNPAKQWPSKHDEVWEAMMMGTPLPTPNPTFSFRKFTDMLRVAGIDVKKKGHNFQLTPLTDKEVMAMSSGPIKKPGELFYAKVDKLGEPKAKPGGLFDEKATGGHGGKKWAHIPLAEPLPNPVFEKAIRNIAGLTGKEYGSIVEGKKAVDRDNKIVEIGVTGSLTGGAGISRLLQKVDVKTELSEAEKALSASKVSPGIAHGLATPKVDKLLKKVKMLRALDELGMTADEAYVLKNIPVLPPIMRAPSVLGDGTVKWGDINELYQKFGQVNGTLSDPDTMGPMPEELKSDLRKEYYDGVKALMGAGVPYGDQTHKGVLNQIHGAAPKTGFFQKSLMSRRQDMSMRSTIVPEPALELDEVGIPKRRALTIFAPFVVKKLREMGAAKAPLDAMKLIEKKDPAVDRALDLVMQDRLVLLKRDPVLHRHSIQGFKPKLVGGDAIKIHPLTTSGYNADFDGDTMSIYVPVSDDALKEAKAMMPSNNLYSEASGRIMYKPSHESAIGLFKLSRISGESNQKFGSAADALRAVNKGALGINEVSTIKGMKTTPGRVLIASALPKEMQDYVLSDLDMRIDKKGLDGLFNMIAKDHKGEFGDTANKLKDIGNGASYGLVPVFSDKKGTDAIKEAENPKTKQYVRLPTHSLSLADFTPDRALRDKMLGEAQRQVDAIYKSTSIAAKDKDRRATDVWAETSNKMLAAHLKKVSKNPNNLSIMMASGVKPGPDQYKQIALAPVLMTDATGRRIPMPIKHSYSEGLDLGEYWTQQQGARRGTVMKVQEVRYPGTFTKRMVSTVMDTLIVGNDCGTDRGIHMTIGSPDVYDRRLARDFTSKNINVKADTVLTPDLVSKMRASDKSGSVMVRSPLKCEHGKGLCQKCSGLKSDGELYPVGTNVGILAAQALGERSTQLTMKAFHTGGVQSGSTTRAVDDFTRVKQLTDLPATIPNSATVAMKSGRVEKMEKDKTGVSVWIGGERHHVGKDVTGMPLHTNLPQASKFPGYKPWSPPRLGTQVKAGDTLSDPNRTMVNPRDLYRATNNMEQVQNFLVDELSDIYGNDVRREHVETAVKAMSNLTKVRDPGDADGILIGEFQPASQVRALNKQLAAKGKKPIEHSPVLKGVEQIPKNIQEDWMAKMQHIGLKDTLLDGVAIGARSNIHGIHPIPGLVYGAEFGLTAEDVPRTGKTHLKDVPEFAY